MFKKTYNFLKVTFVFTIYQTDSVIFFNIVVIINPSYSIFVNI